MKALILVGGYGTRLRPLTLSRPKPLVEFANKPIVVHQLEALVAAGVTHVVMVVREAHRGMEDVLRPYEKKLGLKFSFLTEYDDAPLGTAGPLKLAQQQLDDGSGEPFFVLNSDVICNYPFKQMAQFHLSHGHEGTMAVTAVEDPSKYGVVLYDNKTSMIHKYIEKPSKYIHNEINTGLYIFSPSMIKRIKRGPVSLERDIFPVMCDAAQMFSCRYEGYWMDIGQPLDFIRALSLYLPTCSEEALAYGPGIEGDVLIDPTAKIGSGCHIGPNVCIGPGVVIEDGVCIKRCTIMKGTVIKSHSWLENSIVGWKCSVGQWVRCENGSVLGEGVSVVGGVHLSGATVGPNHVIAASIPQPKVIM